MSKEHIALFTDLHLGIHKDSKLWIDQCSSAVDFIISTCKERNIKKCVFGGDFLHNRQFINVNTLNVAVSCINKLTDWFDNVYFIIGNHDIYLKNSVDVHSLKFLDLLKSLSDKIEVITESTQYKFGNLDALFIPWLGKFDKCVTGDKKFDIIIGHLDLDIGFFIKEYFIESQTKKANLESIQEYLRESDLFEYDNQKLYTKEPTRENSIAKAKRAQKRSVIKFSKLCKNNAVVYSGHFHKHSTIANKGWEFLFIGCPLELTWADADNPKGMYIINTENGEREFIENTNGIKHIKIIFSSYDVVKYKDRIKNNLVKLYIDVEPDPNKTREVVQEINSYQPLQPCEIKYEYIKDISSIVDENTISEAYSKMKMSKSQLMDTYIDSLDQNIDKTYIKKLANAYYNRALKL